VRVQVPLSAPHFKASDSHSDITSWSASSYIKNPYLTQLERIEILIGKYEDVDQYTKTDWCFFDTNCLSELVKLFENGNQSAVHSLIEGKSVLITTNVLGELLSAIQQTTSSSWWNEGDTGSVVKTKVKSLATLALTF
jgi:hypothetical protein